MRQSEPILTPLDYLGDGEAWRDGTVVREPTIAQQLDKIVSDLAANEGARRIGLD